MSLRDQPRVFVYVIGGVADFIADPHADVCVVDGDNLATDPQYTPTVPARFADLAKHFDIPVTDEGAQPATAPQATSDAQQLRTLCLSLLSMLTDLNKGYPWRELHIDLDQCMKTAGELGVPIDELEET